MIRPRYQVLLMLLYMIMMPTQAGIVAYGICQAGCAGVVTVCFAAAGFTFGTVPGAVIAATPALAACNSAYAACYAACAVVGLTPTP